MNDPYIEHDRLLREHHALLRARARSLLVPTADLLQRAALAMRAIMFHHHTEATVFFPYLRRARAHADVSFLDPLDLEHQTLAQLCERIVHAPYEDIGPIARDLVPLLDTHTSDEEAGLAAERLRTLITPGGLVEVARETETLRLAVLTNSRTR